MLKPDRFSCSQKIRLKRDPPVLDMHLGIDKMQHRARVTPYWPGIDMDIAEYIKRRKTCTQHKATQHIQPMIPRDVPEAPLARPSS